MRHPFLAIAALAIVPLGLEAAPPRDGRQVYSETCVACHGTGRDGAPVVGDAKAWAPLAARGLGDLTGSALTGVRRMPPHGGKLSISDDEIRRAIAYMVNASGGSWAEPIDRRHLPAARSGEAIVTAQCSKCHAEGLNGAPRLDDRDAWVKRARLGFDGLVRSAIQGHGAMPARGGMANLTDAEMRSAVAYMFQKSGKR